MKPWLSFLQGLESRLMCELNKPTFSDFKINDFVCLFPDKDETIISPFFFCKLIFYFKINAALSSFVIKLPS